jgi:hypothetical protein
MIICQEAFDTCSYSVNTFHVCEQVQAQVGQTNLFFFSTTNPRLDAKRTLNASHCVRTFRYFSVAELALEKQRQSGSDATMT